MSEPTPTDIKALHALAAKGLDGLSFADLPKCLGGEGRWVRLQTHGLLECTGRGCSITEAGRIILAEPKGATP